jgi:hypothetical protein
MKTTTRYIPLAALGMLMAGCCLDGSGDMEEETRSIGGFDRLEVDVPATIHISQGETHSLRIRTDDNIIDRIVTKVSSRTLVIEGDPPNRCFDPTSLNIWVSTPSIRSIDIDGSSEVILQDPVATDHLQLTIDGSGDVSSEGIITADTVTVDINGSGDVDLRLDVIDLQTRVDGSGNLYFEGAAAFHDIQIDGSAEVAAFNLETSVTAIDIDGSGDCRVWVNDELNVSIDGSGSVAYRGYPAVSQRIDGSGSVTSAN